MAYAARLCEVCQRKFVPPHRAVIGNDYTTKNWCPQCRRAGDADVAAAVQPHTASNPPLMTPIPGEPPVPIHPPLIQAVLDIETFGLDRGWGVMMVGHVMIHEGKAEPTFHTFTLRQSPTWPDKRSDDSWVAAQMFEALKPAHILYAHNGEYFDIKWFRTLALRWGLDWREKKLIDPCQIARTKYAVGNNSLSAVAGFLGIPEAKMPVPAEVWRRALLDDDTESWDVLVARCQSDVRILNAIAGAMTKDVGMIDFRGSAWR